MTQSDLPDSDTLYAALLARDPAWEGRAYVAVVTTGIFCRLTCPAPKPLQRNCRFHPTVADCLAGGFRACKRCNPLGRLDPAHADLLAALRADPARRWSEADLQARGLDPSTLRRAFQRHFGQTFLGMARALRLALAGRRLAAGERVIDAQLEAGFDSASGFRAAFARLTGHAPAALTGAGGLTASFLETPLGGMVAVCDGDAVRLLEFTERRTLAREMQALSRAVAGRIGLGRTDVTDRLETELQRYFTGASTGFTLPVAPLGTTFQQRVWAALQEISPGQTLTYGALATRLGRPDAVRAVAAANAANPIAILIPCHRLIGADGSLTGYGGGLWRKERLIALERATMAGGESLDGVRLSA